MTTATANRTDSVVAASKHTKTEKQQANDEAKLQFTLTWMRKRHAARVIQNMWKSHSKLHHRAQAFGDTLWKKGGVMEQLLLEKVMSWWKTKHFQKKARWLKGVGFTCSRIGLVYLNGESKEFPRKILVKLDGIEILNNENGKTVVFHPYSNLKTVEVSAINKREVNIMQQNYFLETYSMVDARGFVDAYSLRKQLYDRKQAHEPGTLKEFAKTRPRREIEVNLIPSNTSAQKAVGNLKPLSEAFKASLHAEDESIVQEAQNKKAAKRQTKWNSQLQLVQAANALFTPLQEPWEDEYLATSANSGKKKGGETHNEWRAKLPTIPAGNNRSKLYIVMLGDRFDESTTPRVAALLDFLKAYFHGILVERMPPMPVKGEYRDRGYRIDLKLGAKREQVSQDIVLSEHKVLKTLQRLMPHDAFAIIAITMNDTYKVQMKKKKRKVVKRKKCKTKANNQGDEDSLFADAILKAYRQRRQCSGAPGGIGEMVVRRSSVASDGSLCSERSYGSSSSRQQHRVKRFAGRVAVVNLARIDPLFHHDNQDLPLVNVDDIERRQLLLRRGCISLAQSVMKLFEMQVCPFYQCCMNGYNTLDEFSCIPLHVCPVCLRKLFTAIGIQTSTRCVERYNSIRVFCHVNQGSFKHEIRWYGARADYLERMKEKTLAASVFSSSSHESKGGDEGKSIGNLRRNSGLLLAPLNS